MENDPQNKESDVSKQQEIRTLLRKLDLALEKAEEKNESIGRQLQALREETEKNIALHQRLTAEHERILRRFYLINAGILALFLILVLLYFFS